MTTRKKLLSKSVSDECVRIDSKNKSYTIPRTYGIYEILRTSDTKKFRFGNHPVRENELKREFEFVQRIGLFFDREEAKVFAVILNR